METDSIIRVPRLLWGRNDFQQVIRVLNQEEDVDFYEVDTNENHRIGIAPSLPEKWDWVVVDTSLDSGLREFEVVLHRVDGDSRVYKYNSEREQVVRSRE